MERNKRPSRLLRLDKRLGKLALPPFQYNPSAVPPLFHYATCDVLRIVLSTQEMAATLHRDLEAMELRVAHPIVERKVAELEAAAQPRRAKVLRLFREMYFPRPVADHVPIYLTCFSSARDRASLWASFGAEVCIGLTLFPDETAPLDYDGVQLHRIFAQVNYDLVELERRIEKGFRDVLDEYDRFAVRHALLGRHDEGISETKLNLMLVAAYAEITSKDPAKFRQEDEWRWVASPEDPNEVDLKGVKVKPDGKRFITLRMREKPKRLVFSEIIARDAAVATTVEKILDDTGYVGPERPLIVISGS